MFCTCCVFKLCTKHSPPPLYFSDNFFFELFFHILIISGMLSPLVVYHILGLSIVIYIIGRPSLLISLSISTFHLITSFWACASMFMTKIYLLSIQRKEINSPRKTDPDPSVDRSLDSELLKCLTMQQYYVFNTGSLMELVQEVNITKYLILPPCVR